MSLYPSLEALTIGKEIQAQTELTRSIVSSAGQTPDGPMRANYSQLAGDFLGLDLSRIRFDDYGNAVYVDPSTECAAVVAAPGQSIALPETPAAGQLVKRDPIDITNAVREINVCKNKKGIVGLQLRDLDSGILISYVECDSPAAIAGLRFGDQILKIDDNFTAGLSGQKAMGLVKKASANITFIIRDRPLERTVSLSKDSYGSVGIVIKDGKVSDIVKDSSAARNGVLIDHQILEVNGRNVIGLKDKGIRDFMASLGDTVKLTVMPSFFFSHIIKKLGSSYMKQMDRSEPLV